MKKITPVIIADGIEGFVLTDTKRDDICWVTYIDYNLSYRLNKIIQFKNMPYRPSETIGWHWGKATIINE